MQYHKDGTKVIESQCPKCHSEDDVTWGGLHFDAGLIEQRGYCDSCDVEWYDVYQLVRQELVEEVEVAMRKGTEGV